MLHIREAVVVEGRYDKNALSQVVDTLILETAGFGIFKDRDQMALLRRAELRLPSLFNNSTQSKDGDLLRHPEKLGSQTLSAGSSSSSLPVISLSDDSVFSLTARPGIVRPFGFSDTPLQIEGNIALPDPQVQQPRYHILVEPQYLQPR